MTTMTDEERFKRAFSSIKIPEDFVLNLDTEKVSKKPHGMNIRRFAAVACTAAAVLIGGTACYAANVGGIQRTVQVWFHGDQTDAVMTIDGKIGITNWTLPGEKGETIHSGGVAINDDGTDSPLSEEDIKELYDMPDRVDVDGRIYIYCKNQKIDITDQFDDDGICYVTVKDGKTTWYVTTVKSGGTSIRPDRYTEKDELPKEWFEN